MERRAQFAGFWRRFLALIIDYNIVMFGLFPVFICGGWFFPDAFVVEDPYGLFSTEQVIEESRDRISHADGSLSVVDQQVVEKVVLGHWTYHYLDVQESIANETEHSRTLIDPLSRKRSGRISDDDYILIVLIIYWSLMESGRHRASFGKRILGIEVVDARGGSLTRGQAFGRNLGKFLSLFTCFIGFMMAGWTQRKQGLHDQLANCLVVVGRK